MGIFSSFFVDIPKQVHHYLTKGDTLTICLLNNGCYMVTIRDIAKKSKVTPGTVSMILNGRGSFSDETRSRIEAVVAQTGYKHKSVGRPQRKKNVATTIAVVYAQRVACGGMLSRLSQAWLESIRETAIGSKCHLSLIGGFKDGSQDDMFRHAIDDGKIDGVILIGITADDGHAYLTQSIAKGIPTVAMNRIPVHSEFSYVAMDNFGSGKQAVDFLIGHGHKSIAMVHQRSNDRYAADRRAGAEAAVAARDMQAVCVEEMDPEPTEDEVNRVCNSVAKSNATAVYFTVGDLPAIKCVDKFESMGLKIPKDLSVVGWDDLGRSSQSGLIVTSIGYDKQVMGREAVQMLLQLMSKNATACSRGMIVPTRVIEHDTTAVVSSKPRSEKSSV